MRRTSAIVAVLFSGITGCSGTEAQVPYDGLIAEGPRAAAPVGGRAVVDTAVVEPIASASNVPWSIALLSDGPDRRPRPVKRSGKVTIVQAEPEPTVEPDAFVHEADVHVVLEPEPIDEKPADVKPATSKSCSGVVNRRS